MRKTKRYHIPADARGGHQLRRTRRRSFECLGILSVRYGHAKLLAMGYFDLVGSMVVNGIHHDGHLEWTDLHHPNGGLLLDPPFFR